MTEADRPTDGSKRVISQPGPCVDLSHWAMGGSRGSLGALGPSTVSSSSKATAANRGAAALSLSLGLDKNS